MSPFVPNPQDLRVIGPTELHQVFMQASPDLHLTVHRNGNPHHRAALGVDVGRYRMARSGNFRLPNEKPGVWPKPDAGGLTPSPRKALASAMLVFFGLPVNVREKFHSRHGGPRDVTGGLYPKLHQGPTCREYAWIYAKASSRSVLTLLSASLARRRTRGSAPFVPSRYTRPGRYGCREPGGSSGPWQRRRRRNHHSAGNMGLSA